MHRSHPSDPKAPKVAPKITDEPIEDRPEDRRTLEVRGGVMAMAFSDGEEEPLEERETAPPPIPVADYVRAMMQHADTVEGPSSRSPGSQSEDEEFERRPLSLRRAEPLGASTEPDPWHNVQLQPAPDRRLAGLRAPTKPSLPRPLVAPSAGGLTPPSGSKAPQGLPPLSKQSAPASPAASLNRPLPPPPVLKGTALHPTPRAVPRAAIGRLLAKETPVGRPLGDPAVDAELDSLSFDDLVSASHRSSPPAAAPFAPPKPAAPPPVAAPRKAPVPAGLRLGKQPLSSFPPVLEAPEEDAAGGGDIPPILDVAWAFNSTRAEAEEGHRDAALPGSTPAPRWEGPPRPQKSDSIPPILDVGWALSSGSYEESNEMTLAGSLEDDLQPVDELQARFDEGDFAGALLLAERLLALDPDDARARGVREIARDRLIDAYSIELGGRRRVPHVIMDTDEIRWLALDHRAGFLLSCIDGQMSVEEVLDVSCMPMLDALRILCDLRDQRVISVESFEPRSSHR